MAVDQHAAACVPSHRAGQNLALHVAPGVHQLTPAQRVINAKHVLFDDGPLVEVCGDVVGRRANELDASVERLLVGPGALEAGKERVVDVDRPSFQGPAGAVGEHLHVAGKDDQMNVE
jgi:hypothetical protein